MEAEGSDITQRERAFYRRVDADIEQSKEMISVLHRMENRMRERGSAYITEDVRCFSDDPTSRGDEIAMYARRWYEENRESWWERHRPGSPVKDRTIADNFMLRFVQEVRTILEESSKKLSK
jgi:hypothetical protein